MIASKQKHLMQVGCRVCTASRRCLLTLLHFPIAKCGTCRVDLLLLGRSIRAIYSSREPVRLQQVLVAMVVGMAAQMAVMMVAPGWASAATVRMQLDVPKQIAARAAARNTRT